LRENKAREMIALVGLDGWEEQAISNLSGGMKQRVGLARALASDPDVLLMDEPFSALDPLVRREMQFELLSIQSKLEKTIIFITHDINEAFKLGDTVAIMRDGKIIQIDTPERMSARPADDYVREFIESADKTQILTAKHVMIRPKCLVKPKDMPSQAIREMGANDVSTAYVVDDKMKFLGVITIDDAILARDKNLPMPSLIKTDVYTCHEDTILSEILSIAAKSKYPLAVLDSQGKLKGIISKAAVLSSL